MIKGCPSAAFYCANDSFIVTFPILGSHLPTYFRTSEACFRTFLAMLLALISASFTYFGTDSAYFSSVHTVRGHGLSRKTTNIRALTIQADTFFHHGYVLFFQTRSVTVIASYHTTQTFLDTL
ncbi:hypothetical protein AMS62_24275 [Bacillus sp. FJAT-18019]|nr:hypothetical protein AMS62_24275 [Bacillus sp. FJAT-18019]